WCDNTFPSVCLPIIEKKKNFIMVDLQEQQMNVFADKEKLYQLIQNLIMNANKYTSEGKIQCIVSQTSSFISIVIKDNGNGLNHDQKANLVKVFKDTSSQPFALNESIGIELAIVKELVHLHLGEIHLESELDQGTSFTITLPQEKIETLTTSVIQHETMLNYSMNN
ncbi:MAG: ATP-binding protein, partial [Candidatus Margulisiibacteriota bacterium]